MAIWARTSGLTFMAVLLFSCVGDPPTVIDSPDAGTAFDASSADGSSSGADTDTSAPAASLRVDMDRLIEVGVPESFSVTLVDPSGSMLALDSRSYTVENLQNLERSGNSLVGPAPGPASFEVRYNGEDELVEVVELDVDFVIDSIEVGDDHACVVTTRGNVWCWGQNDFGQLGRGSETGTTDPQPFEPVNRTFDGPVIDLECGDDACLAVTTTGSVFGWGSTEDNRIGLAADGDVLFPTQLALEGISAVDVAFERAHACALGEDGSLVCWGRNGFGQLATGSADPIDGTVTIDTPATVQKVAVGLSATCFAGIDGSVWCAGEGAWLHSGDNIVSWQQFGPPADSSGQAFDVAVGVEHICVLSTGGTWCLGEADAFLGPADNTDELGPTPISYLSGIDVARIETEQEINFVLDTDDNWYVFGVNQNGAALTGNADDVFALEPLTAPDDQAVLEVSTGAVASCMLTSSNRIYCAGSNQTGILGPGFPEGSVTLVEYQLPWERSQ
jgi:alpha-tubulin suppressor-like RCC1 family protein